MTYLSSSKLAALILLIVYLFLSHLTGPWIQSEDGYKRGNRRRFIAVLKIEVAMIVFNIFVYHQLMAFFNENEEWKSKADRKLAKIWRDRCSIALIIFFFLGQMIYFMYYAPNVLQYLFFDLTAVCAGLWTNLLAFVSGFFIVNVLIGPFNKFPPTRCFLSLFEQVPYFRSLMYDRRSQIKFSLWATVILSFLMWFSCDKIMVKNMQIPIKNLSADGDSIKFAIVSDIHAGGSVSRNQVDHVVDRLLHMKVDAVLIVGDMVDGTVAQIGSRVAPFWHVANRFPTYFVTGNHEYYIGNVMEWIDLYEKHHIHVLQNNHTMFHGICLAGVNDISSGKMGIEDHKMNVSSAIRGCPQNATRVLLAHNPASVLDIDKVDLQTIDLILSGHTHAGQFYVVLPVVYWMLPYYYGLYDLPFGKLMVTAGTLYQGPPMKMLWMSEIWELELVKSD